MDNSKYFFITQRVNVLIAQETGEFFQHSGRFHQQRTVKLQSGFQPFRGDLISVHFTHRLCYSEIIYAACRILAVNSRLVYFCSHICYLYTVRHDRLLEPVFLFLTCKLVPCLDCARFGGEKYRSVARMIFPRPTPSGA